MTSSSAVDEPFTKVFEPDLWYRTNLPAASTSNPTFSSQIKTTYEWIVTLTPTGELSLRAYRSNGDKGVVTMRGLGGGGGVGDWDVSQMEDGTLVVGGLDGSVRQLS
jgi:hypothetical protein